MERSRRVEARARGEARPIEATSKEKRGPVAMRGVAMAGLREGEVSKRGEARRRLETRRGF